MATYFDVNPENPQPRSITQVARIITQGGLVVYPTDSGFAFGCALGNVQAQERIKRIRKLDHRHHFTLMVADFSNLGAYVTMDTRVFRAIKAATPGSFTFILKATRELPRAMLHPKKRTVGVRIPNHVTAQALLADLGAPMLTSTLMLPDHEEPLTSGWEIKELLDHQVDAVLDSGDVGLEFTTVVDLSQGEAEILRPGAGDPHLFE